MAIIYDASTAGGSINTSGSTITFSHTVGSGSNRILLVGVGIEDNPTARSVGSVTYNGVALSLTRADGITEATVGARTEIWHLLEATMPAAGSYNVVVTMATAISANDSVIAAATSFSGVKQLAPIANGSVSAVDSSTFSTGITTANDGSYVYDVILGNTNNTWTATAVGQIERTDQQAGGGLSTSGTSTKPVTTAGATTMDWTASGTQGRYSHSVAAISPEPLIPTTVAGTTSMPAPVIGAFNMNLALAETVRSFSTVNSPSLVIDDANWWRSTYLFRRPLDITFDADAIPSGHPIEFELSTLNTLEMGKIRSDLADIEVLYLNDDDEGEVLASTATQTDTIITVRFTADFSISESVSDRFYVYYGNDSLYREADDVIYVESLYPISVGPDAQELSYLRPGEEWVNGVSSIRGSIATVTTYMDKVAIRFQKSLNGGIAEIQLDDGAWEPYDLFSATTITEDVYVVDDIPLIETEDEDGVVTSSSIHTVRIRVSTQKSPRSSGYEVAIDRVLYERYIVATPGSEEIVTLPWITI